MRPEDYTVIQGWMYSLDLTDKQRIAYAIIWGYSRDGRSVCRTTARQLAEWLDCTERNVKYIIRQLEDRGLIGHEVVAVSARRGHCAGVMTDFWAVLPEDAEKPEKKARIDWAGRAKVGKPISLPGREADFPTPYKGSNNQKHLTGGGEKNARSRAKGTTTTTGFLFDQNGGTGLTAGEPEVLALPYEEPYFREAWAKLIRQPKWTGKSTDALQITLDRLAVGADPAIATWCCLKAIEKGWDTIKDPQAIADADWDALLAWSGTLQNEEGER